MVKHFPLTSNIVTTLLLLLVTGISSGEVTLDGSLGPNDDLSGPNYHIPASLGRQVGTNLFHSFDLFSVNTGESATFSGLDPIKNIIARITGGSVSNIDGLIRSTIPSANLFLLNPTGIIFGPNASLDVKGAFHASTADYLRLSDGLQFTAIASSDDDLLTTAPIASFGFLGTNSAEISIDQSVLEVPKGKTLSLIAGNVSIAGVTRIKDGKTVNPGDPDFNCRTSCLRSKGGTIQIASVTQKSEVPIDLSQYNRTSPGSDGLINIEKNVLIDVSDNQAGNIIIRAGHFIVNSTEFRTNSAERRDDDSKVMNLTAVENITLNNAVLTSMSKGKGPKGAILIEAKQVLLEDGTQIRSGPLRSQGSMQGGGSGGGGNGGNQSGNGGGSGGNQGNGQNDSNDITGSGGDIILHAEQSIILRQEVDVSANSNSSSDAGNVQFEAPNIEILDGSRVGSNTASSGNSGNVTIRASEGLLVAGTNGNQDPKRNRSSRITVAARFGASGDAWLNRYNGPNSVTY